MGAYYCNTCCKSGVDIVEDSVIGIFKCSECGSVMFDDYERPRKYIEHMRRLLDHARHLEYRFDSCAFVWRIGDDMFDEIAQYLDRTNTTVITVDGNTSFRIFGIRVELDHEYKKRLQLFKEIIL